MLDEYKSSDIWRNNPDRVNLRSDLLVTQRVIELLGDISGKKILDAGCGNGKVSRLLVKRGARVFAVDKIEDQITTANNTDPRQGIDYFVGDISDLSKLSLPNDFDIALSLMAFLYLNEQEFINAAIQIRAHIKHGSRFIYGNVDPARFNNGDSTGGIIEKLEAELPTVNGEVFKTTFYMHPYSFVIKTFTDAGFIVCSEIKPKETDEEVIQYPSLFPKETIGKSQYIILNMEAI